MFNRSLRIDTSPLQLRGLGFNKTQNNENPAPVWDLKNKYFHIHIDKWFEVSLSRFIDGHESGPIKVQIDSHSELEFLCSFAGFYDDVIFDENNLTDLGFEESAGVMFLSIGGCTIYIEKLKYCSIVFFPDTDATVDIYIKSFQELNDFINLIQN